MVPNARVATIAPANAERVLLLHPRADSRQLSLRLLDRDSWPEARDASKL
jgi:hypothetical protein